LQTIDELRAERQKWFQWKNIKPIHEAVEDVKKIHIDESLVSNIGDYVTFGEKKDLTLEENDTLQHAFKKLIPWRKGPFKLFDTTIETEWRSDKKYNLIRPHFNLKGKVVADVGCNNGYYMFRMLEDNPTKLVGFDPSPFFNLQFDLVNHFLKTDIKFELLGVEHLEIYEHKFDFIFMLGVLYHRSDPIATLKSLAKALNKNGEILIDTFMIDGEDEVCLTPNSRYSKMPNIYFVPTISALKNWLNRAGFIDIEVLATTVTDSEEQRVTPWTFEQSLDDYLDSEDKTKTVEGYPAPKRVYIKAKKKN
jgi:tRNA (mo5U34)-methyltransferase